MAEEAPRNEELHVLFFPFLAHGHMIPLFDIVCLFAARGVKATVITTQGNAQVFDKELKSSDADIQLELIKFPSEEMGLPAGIENFEDVHGTDVMNMFVDGIRLLRGQLQQLLPQLTPRPCCIVADLFLPWTTEVAAGFGIPRLVFHGTGYIAVSVLEALRTHKPYKEVKSDNEELLVPGVPGEIRLTRSGMSPGLMMDDERCPFWRMAEGVFEAESKSFGVIMNCLHELEHEYEDYSRKVKGVRVWSIGPVPLHNL